MKLRRLIPAILLGAFCLFGLAKYKALLIEDVTERAAQEFRPIQRSIFSDHLPFDRFIVNFPELTGLQVIGKDQSVQFDSRAGQQVHPELEPGAAALLVEVVPSSILRANRLLYWIPESAGRGVIYILDARKILIRLALGVILSALAVAFLFWLDLQTLLVRFFIDGGVAAGKLRTQFLVTIVLINLLTAGFIFLGLTSLQTREQTNRIQRQSILYSRFATERVVRLFVDNFEKNYFESFLPEIKGVIAGNTDLNRLRILSVRTGAVLFDSDRSDAEVTALTVRRPDFPADYQDEIQASDLASRSYVMHLDARTVPLFSVVSTFRGPTHEALFRVEFIYGYNSLEQSLMLIRREILLDLLPALVLGTLIALAFAQVLVSPIKKLVEALRKVTGGDYGESVPFVGAQEVRELISTFNMMTQELRRKQELRKYLSNFSYEQITKAVDTVDKDGVREVPKLGGQRVSATVLFSDIRDFVAHCESMDAEEVTSMLNSYFSEMVGVIQKNGGEIDKFIGDAILAVFYPGPGLASEAATTLQAVYCALEMRTRLVAFNERRVSLGKAPLEIGIGISFGQVISGPIGAENRMDFTVIGDVVNIASRIEKLSRSGRHTRILFSDSVENQIRGLLEYEKFEGGTIRGKLEEVQVFELIGIRQLDLLVANLKSTDVALRARSVELLGQSGNLLALDSVLEAIEDTTEQVRIHAAGSVAKLAPRNDEKSFNALLARLKTESNSKVTSAMIAAAGKICQNEMILKLAPYLQSDDERIVANAIEAIGNARLPSGTDLILRKLDSKNHRIKANAAMAVFAAGRFEVIDILKPMLMQSDPWMRSSAAFAIGELTTVTDLNGLMEKLQRDPSKTREVLAELQECVPMLVALLRDPESAVRRQAVIALGKIRDKAAVLPLISLLDSQDVAADILTALRSIGSHKLVRDLLSKLSV